MPKKWTNWAKNQYSNPHKIFRPKSEAEITEIVSLGVAKRLKVRPIGNGHSFSSIGLTDGFLVSLESMNRITNIDREKLQVTVGAGITISDLNRELHKIGFALPNLGDIDTQSLAGDIATGTHGTGIEYKSISSRINYYEIDFKYTFGKDTQLSENLKINYYYDNAKLYIENNMFKFKKPRNFKLPKLEENQFYTVKEKDIRFCNRKFW